MSSPSSMSETNSNDIIMTPQRVITIPQQSTKSIISENIQTIMARNLKEPIMKLLEPYALNELKSSLIQQDKLVKATNIIEIIAKVILGLASIPSFIASALPEYGVLISAVSGGASVIGTMLLILAGKLNSEAKQRADRATEILNRYGIIFQVPKLGDPDLDD